jgi:hypothetical protein
MTTDSAAKPKVELDVVSEELVKKLPGFVVKRAPSVLDEESYVAVTLSYRADPDKDSLDWITRQMAKMPDMRAFRREYLLDWTSAEGASFYPDFADAPERYVSSRIGFTEGLPVYRGFDFGFRHPACIWLQILPSGRLVVLHDLLPSDIDTYSFRDLVLYLSGETLRPGTNYDADNELRILAKTPRAYHYASKFHKAPPWWGPAGALQKYPVPFFPPGTVFRNFSGPEAYKISATVEGNKKERTDAEVFESGGIYLDCAYQSVSAGETLIRKTLLDMAVGGPGLMCSPSAVNTINALGGGVVYAKPSPVNPRPETASKDGLFEHIHDALRYAITHVIDPDQDLPERAVPEQFRETEDLKEAREQKDSIEERYDTPYEVDTDWLDLDSFC